jgi:DNA-binding MarR family transcriptional regulator
MKGVQRFGLNLAGGVENTVYAVAGIYALLEKRITAVLRPFGLTPAKFNALMVIKHLGGQQGLTQIEIGKRLIVSASNMTRLLDKLHKEGLIERTTRIGDRRVNIIRITGKGAGILDKAWPGYAKQVRNISGLLAENERGKAAELLFGWFKRLEALA